MLAQKTLDKLPPATLFLIDSMGALLSAFMLGVVLVQFETVFGVPPNVLYFLAAIAGVFAGYSFLCYRNLPANWPVYLIIIATANLLYCCLTAVLLYHWHPSITAPGIVYFALEIAVVVVLASVELKKALRGT